MLLSVIMGYITMDLEIRCFKQVEKKKLFTVQFFIKIHLCGLSKYACQAQNANQNHTNEFTKDIGMFWYVSTKLL